MPGLAHTPQELSASNVTHSAMENTGFLLAAIITGFLLGATSPGFVFGVASGVAALATIIIGFVQRDQRPTYADEEGEMAGVVRELGLGLRTLVGHPALRLSAATLTVLLLFEGFADVLVVMMALELLHLEEGSVGFLNASWGLGALLGGAGLALLLDRGKLVIAIAGGSLVLGLATMLPGLWPEEACRLRRLAGNRDRLHLRRRRRQDADAAARLRRDARPRDRLARSCAPRCDGAWIDRRDRARRAPARSRGADRPRCADAGLRDHLLGSPSRLRGRRPGRRRALPTAAARTRSSRRSRSRRSSV